LPNEKAQSRPVLGAAVVRLTFNVGPTGAVTVKGLEASSAGSVGEAMRQQAPNIAPLPAIMPSQQRAHSAPLEPLTMSTHTPAVICATKTAMARHLFIGLSYVRKKFYRCHIPQVNTSYKISHAT
jgi:hypothetical protein